MTTNRARKILGRKAENLSDEQVASLVSQLEVLAEIFIDTYNTAGSKKQLGVIDSKTQQEDDYVARSN